MIWLRMFLTVGLLSPHCLRPKSGALLRVVRTGEALDRAAPGDGVVFLPGLHQPPLSKHRACCCVDKSVEIELKAGATLKLATRPPFWKKPPKSRPTTETPKQRDDLSVGGDYDLSLADTVYTIIIDGEGQNGQPDTFSWGVVPLFNKKVQGVPITGGWQDLSCGVKIRFENRTGHNKGACGFCRTTAPKRMALASDMARNRTISRTSASSVRERSI